jgi:bifunctional enzyme CysN/CysC
VNAILSALPTKRFAVVGHVDHGKSTLLGRILLDVGRVPDDKVNKVKQLCNARNSQFEPAFLLDAFAEEQDQGVSIDTTAVELYFAERHYLLIDAPGHVEFLKNMISGSALADYGILIVDCQEGIRDQTLRHLRVLKAFSIVNILVVVNKMDRLSFSRTSFDQCRKELESVLQREGIAPFLFIPASALTGENVTQHSQNSSWYEGPCLTEALALLSDHHNQNASQQQKPFRMLLQDVYRFDDRRHFVGRVISGEVNVGDRILFSPAGKTSAVQTIETYPEGNIGKACAGDSIALTLTEQIFVERGNLISLPSQAPETDTEFNASLIWFGAQPLDRKKRYLLKLGTAESICAAEIRGGHAKMGEDATIRNGSIVKVAITCEQPLSFDCRGDMNNTGQFVLCTDCETVAAGKIEVADFEELFAEQEAPEADSNGSGVDRKAIELRQCHSGKVLWLTGLSGSGKSTIATALQQKLFERGFNAVVLDGDEMRHRLCADLGFSPADRSENIRRIAHVARLFLENGAIVMVACISPFSKDREAARLIAGSPDFVEIFVQCPLSVCQSRDPKGLYRRTTAGEISGLTGYDAPYQPPTAPHLVLDTTALSVDAEVSAILEYLENQRAPGSRSFLAQQTTAATDRSSTAKSHPHEHLLDWTADHPANTIS